MNIKKITILSLVILFVVGFKSLNTAFSKPVAKRFHTDAELIVLKDSLRRAPIVNGEYFLASNSCGGCHGYDSAHVSNINESGNDVNLVERWESSMMANAAKDPLWRAKVSQEITINPGHSGILQNKCTSCHAPMGRFTSMFHGNPFYGITDLEHDSLGLDGVSCGACHKISPNTGFSYSGNTLYDTTHVEYGPFTAPSVGPMQLYEGFTPTFSSHMDNAKLCSSCHTLITQSADLAGNLTGGEFVEQATYHEFENSNFPSQNIKCQTCHMPQNLDGIVIANGFLGLTPRVPFNQHTFVGANSFMVNMIKNNRDSLGVYVPVDKFDSTIVAALDMLKNKSINYHLTMDNITSDTAFFSVKIENKVGHKFPSGYPSRRAVVQFVVLDANSDTVFQSGIYNAQQRVMGENPAWEPHHNIINQSGVSQIYEMAMGDVNSNFTSVLERASVLLKDNRIPPAGFTTTHPVYDTCKISADALADDDFNKVNTVEGSGIDYVHYHVPVTGHTGPFSVKTKVYYQSVPPKWTDEMFTLNTAPINRFKTMYQNADQTPILVAKDSMNNINLPLGIKNNTSTANVKVFPTISLDGKVYVSAEYGTMINSIEVYNAEGKLINKIINSGFQTDLIVDLPTTSGTYYLRLNINNKIITKKVIKS